jgi:hypothetical protein
MKARRFRTARIAALAGVMAVAVGALAAPALGTINKATSPGHRARLVAEPGGDLRVGVAVSAVQHDVGDGDAETAGIASGSEAISHDDPPGPVTPPATAADAAVLTESLGKTYPGGTVAVAGLSPAVRRGGVLALLGQTAPASRNSDNDICFARLLEAALISRPTSWWG